MSKSLAKIQQTIYNDAKVDENYEKNQEDAKMDISYLLFLQDLRNATGGVFDELMNAITKFSVDILPLLPFIVFWCVDKKWGYRFLTTINLGKVINGIIKLTVCAYRPWIRSELIEPAGDSKVAATGYSFPSGHSMCATTMYGTTAVWQWKKRRWIAVLCGIMIALTMFSRNFLGVHTPQDVLVAFLESIIIIFIVGKATDKLSGNDKAIDILTFVGVVFIIAAILYITLKPYPMDYVNGELLVDPKTMTKDCFSALGGFLGLLIGSYVERHFLPYEIPKGAANLALLSCIGFGLAFAWDQWFSKAIVTTLLGRDWGAFVGKGLLFIFAILLWPAVIKKYTSAKSLT